MQSVRRAVLMSALCCTAALAAGNPPAPTGVVLPKDEKSFLEALHHVNEMEIEMGKLAQQKGVTQDVKDFGQKMVTDHQQADQQLMAYAKQANLKLGEPKPTSEVEKKAM